MADERNSELRKCSAAVATGHGHGEPVNDWEPCRAPRCGCSDADSGRDVDVDAVETCDDTYCDDAVAQSHQAACHAMPLPARTHSLHCHAHARSARRPSHRTPCSPQAAAQSAAGENKRRTCALHTAQQPAEKVTTAC
jgi:hypothetical protein